MASDDLIVRIKALFGNNFLKNLKKADKQVDSLKDSVKGLNLSLKDTKKASKAVTVLQKLEKQFKDTSNKARTLKDKINDLKNTKGKTAKQTEKLNRKLRDAKRQYGENTKKLKPLKQAITQVKRETKRLGVDTSNLTKEQIRLAKATDHLKDQELRLSRARRSGRGFFSAGAAIARGGFKSGSLISAGTALGAAGHGGIGGSLILKAALAGAGVSAFNSILETGGDLDKIVTDISTRQRGKVNKKALSGIIEAVNEKFIFNLADTGGAFSLASRSGITGESDLKNFSASALRFAQAEDLSATKGADVLIKLGNAFGRDKVGGADELSNLLSATATSAATDVPELFQALRAFVKPAKELAKLNTGEILGVTSLLADVGLGGSRGTTSFKTAFAKVVKGQSKKFAGATGRIAEKTGLQIDVRDAETGGALPFLDILRQLEEVKKVGGKAVEGDLQIAIAELIGSRTLPQAFSFLEEGVDGILARTKKIQELAGTDLTGRLATSRLGTFEGQKQRFTSVLDNLKSSLFKGGIGDLAFSTLKELNSGILALKNFVETDPTFMPNLLGILSDVKTVVVNLATAISPVLNPLLAILRLATQGIARISTLLNATAQAVGAKLTGSGNFADTFNRVNRKGQLQTDLAGEKDPARRAGILKEISKIDAVQTAGTQKDNIFKKLARGQSLTTSEIAAANTSEFQSTLDTRGRGANSPFVQAAKNLAFQDERTAFAINGNSVSTKGGAGTVNNNVQIQIDGSGTPEQTAQAVKKAIEGMTFSNMTMEVPLN